MKNHFRGKISVKLAFAGVGSVIALSFCFGVWFGKTGKTVETLPVANAQSEAAFNADFSLFWDSVKLIKNKYFDANKVTDEQILYGAIRGAFQSLNDPYSTFFEPSDAKKFHEDLEGVFGGIGAEIGLKNGQIVIVAPLKGNPAEKAGFKAGDRILEVNGTSTAGLAVEDAVKIIRGQPDTVVKLLIMRDGWSDAKEFEITRAIINVPTLEWETKEGNIVYLKLHNFNSNLPDLMYLSAISMLMQRPNGIVLDLRNNPGGFLDVSIDTASWFLQRGKTVVRERFNANSEDRYIANGNASLSQIPIVVLINGGSASASEILAGALRDARGAKLVGEKTFGKGTVQEVRDLRNGSSVKISIAEWLTPNGDSINNKGLNPDYEVKLTEDDTNNGVDPQLDKALEVLKEELKTFAR
ncbi:hypothetical protein A3D55_01190 [Candidatus Jorgensenbacteria bacterium RIFCSPHIGHO2_02_FULL_45_20]|uniref:PDZ domain-containing protein n=2 Tax=Candidatus Joergenseniibacteriota TaxID=1752739 RepID=A0A1F6BN12_9BACT|nr:MAG: Carboxyl-terminal protease [Candidatus Jorgensenbacteria bacterium GW2011_GWA2_45_9]OGG38314.1 MAG: hypothetical protein A3D55_01190 [Candidatus Jorgensenbacteria bacterium RIFCSPHIGHO2_02_FULL_45_20]